MKIDNREPSWVQEAFPNASVESLPIGDIASDDYSTIIERKHITDLASSIMDGRYRDQLATLVNYSSFIIVVGSVSDLESNHSSLIKSTVSALSSIPMKYRIPLFHTGTNTGFISIVNEIFAKRSSLSSSSLAPPIKINRLTPDPRLRVLCSLPNISVKKASTLLSHYASVSLALADISNWHTLEGFGPVIVKKCVNVLESLPK